MSSIPYMPLYIADYMADAAHLSTLEHGAYLLLIMTYWQRGKPLPNSDERLANVARMSVVEWGTVKPVLAEFFCDDGDSWCHKRIDAELSRFRDKSAKASAAGKASAQQRHNKRSTPVERTHHHTDTDTSVDDSARVDKIFEWLQALFNSPTPLFSSPIVAWLRWGADFELDIKPVAQRWRKGNPKKAIRSLEWLDDDIAASIKKRTKPMPENTKTSGGSNAHPSGRATTFSNPSGSSGTNKTDRAKAAVIRAAVAGGYAPVGQPGQTGTGDDAVSVFSRPQGLG
jgi:uncharacterized protein YdaU (DUF1376 family)